MLSNMDLSGCLIRDCHLCQGGVRGASHTRSGALYKGSCKICGKIYWGETGDNGFTRTRQHIQLIIKNEKSNTFTKHLQLEHPDQEKNLKIFSMKIEKVFKKSLDRQVTEGVKILLMPENIPRIPSQNTCN